MNIFENHEENQDLLKQIINKTDQIGNTKLFYIESIQVLELYIKNGGNINHKNNESENALFGANYEKTFFLINNNIDINNINNYCYNSMIEADFDVLKLLVEKGIDINNKDQNGCNILFYYNDVERIKYLIEKGIKIEKTPLESNILMINGVIKEKAALDYLIDNKIVDINEVDKKGHNALYENIKCHPEYSIYLIKKGINIDDKSLYNGMDILDFIEKLESKGKEDLIHCILRKRSENEKISLLSNLDNNYDILKKTKRL